MPKKSPENVEQGERLREMRVSLGMSLDEFSAAIGREPKTIRLAEAGNQALGRRTWERVMALKAQGGTRVEVVGKAAPAGQDRIADIAAIVANPANADAVTVLAATGLTLEAAWEARPGARPRPRPPGATPGCPGSARRSRRRPPTDIPGPSTCGLRICGVRFFLPSALDKP